MTAAFLNLYGAFEIKSGARQRMALAAAGSAFLVVAAVVSAVLLAEVSRRLVKPTEKEVVLPSFDPFFPRPYAPHPPPPPTAAPRDRNGKIVPVADAQAPPDLPAEVNDLNLATGSKPGTGTAPSLQPNIGADPTATQPPSPLRPSPWDAPIVDEYPVLLHSVAVRYPDLAREAGIEGPVYLKVLVGIDGRVEDVVIMQGIAVLNDAAVAAARQYTFRPAFTNRRVVAVWVGIPMIFRLRGN